MVPHRFSREPARFGMDQRKDITALRGIAVLLVVLFHFKVPGFSTGFLGVDIFFVISGYLIIGKLRQQFKAGRLSLSDFAARRIRRLFPALIATILVTGTLSLVLLNPLELEALSMSAISVVLLVSNLYFWTQTGYFAEASESLPLLHAWSLSLEEQMYVLVPLAFAALLRSGYSKPKGLDRLLLGALIVSLLASEVASRFFPSANFFMVFFRAWEFLVGGLIVLLPELKPRSSAVVRACGLGLILLSTFLYAPDFRHPSLLTLAPVIGAALVLRYAPQETTSLVEKLMTNRGLVRLGVLSYSIYLVHTPLLVFGTKVAGESRQILLLLLLLPLSYILWRFVEQRFRYPREAGNRKTFVLASNLTIFTLIFSLTLPLLQSLSFTENQRNWVGSWKENRTYMKSTAYERGICFLDLHQTVDDFYKNGCMNLLETKSEQPRVFLLGDSEAAHLLDGTTLAAQALGMDVVHLTMGSCWFSVGQNMERCRQYAGWLEESLAQEVRPQDAVLIGSNWLHYKNSLGPEFQNQLESLLTSFRMRTNKVVIATNAPSFPEDPYRVGFETGVAREPTLQMYLPVRGFRDSDEVIRNAASGANVMVFESSDGLCLGDSCLFIENGEFLFFDTGHYSTVQSIRLKSRLVEVLAIKG